jgi:hypothetical protein
MTNRILIALCTLCLALAIPAAAHHSMTGFDREKVIAVEGVVKSFAWQNPHCYLEVEVTGKDGKAVVWNFEMTAPGYLVRAGWKKSFVTIGDHVKVEGNPLLNGEPGALFVSITGSDGRKLTQRGVAEAAK